MKKFLCTIRSGALVWGSVLLAAILFAACSKNNDNDSNIPAAGLMAFNLAPDKAGIGITLSGNSLTNAPLLYTNYTGGYLPIYPGSRTARAYDYFMGNMLTATANNFEPNKYYSLFVVGANNNYTNVVTNDNLDSLAAAQGQSYIRFINAIPDSAAPRVVITAPNTSIVNAHAAFATVSDFTAIGAGQVNIDINNGSTIQANRTIDVTQAKAYTVLLIGQPNATDTTGKIQIRYIENGTLTGGSGQKNNASAKVSSSK